MVTAAAVFPSTTPMPRPKPLPASLYPDAPSRAVPQAAHASAEAELTSVQEQLLKDHLPLVRYVARSVAERLPPHVELEELIGAGMLGLVDAARKFSMAKNVQFRSYAQFRVRGAILDSLRSLDWGPRELRRRGRAMQLARQALETRLGRPAAENELAGEMGITLAELQALSGDLRSLEITALNVERSENADEELLAFLPASEAENPLRRVLAHEARERVTAAIDALPERERLVMRLYYFEEMTMQQIGEVLGVVESRISQIHRETLRKLRTALGGLRRSTGRASTPRRVA